MEYRQKSTWLFNMDKAKTENLADPFGYKVSTAET